MIKGIDLSAWQEKVDYQKLKEEGIEFAIIRCGYGKNSNQKDKMFEKHYRELKAIGIKVGAYLYSYCNSVENSILEAKNCLEFIKGKQFDLPIFYDLEDEITRKLGRIQITQIALNFCEEIEKQGYTAGIYANLDWFKNYIDISKVEKYKIWLAHWNVKEPGGDFRKDFWQYAVGYLEGIEGKVDLDYMLEEIQDSKKSIEEIAKEVIEGKWDNGEQRKINLENAGYNYNEIQTKVNELMKSKPTKRKSNETIAKEVIKGKWDVFPKRKQLLEEAGYNYAEIQTIVNKLMK